MAERYDHILYEVQNEVAHIVLNRPEKLNALGMGPGSSRDEIARALTIASDDESIGSVLIRAAGRAFCAGGDLSRIGGKIVSDTARDNQIFNENVIGFNEAVRRVRKPVIAAVHGLCLGTAMGFVAQCDFVIAADTARFGLIEGRIGHPGASDLVPVIGAAWTKYLIFTGEMIDAWRAERIGLVLGVEPEALLIERAVDLAERLARMPREALHLNKACIEGVLESSGRAAGRVAGRAHDAITKTMSSVAKAPDGRYFEDILRAEGMEGLKAARAGQYSTPWLPASGK
ncbi:MAG: enoyl-CoA hydratase/isomerase family protein [Qipengyuania sp.]|nr:enoyl-CoA hydratase/isomerase family protein [Qipengyuania sp.]